MLPPSLFLLELEIGTLLKCEVEPVEARPRDPADVTRIDFHAQDAELLADGGDVFLRAGGHILDKE